MTELTLEERLGDRIRRTENERGWLLGTYNIPFSKKLYAATAAMMLDDAERTSRAYFSIKDFKVYVLRLIAATDSEEFFKGEEISKEGKIQLAEEISRVKTQLAAATANHSDLCGEKLEEVIILDVGSLERLGGSQLKFAGDTIAVLAKQAFLYVLYRGKRATPPYLDKQDRQEKGKTISYKLVK